MTTRPLNSYRWFKTGLSFDSKSHNPIWGQTHALVPTPVVIENGIFAIFSSYIDHEFRGRIGRVDFKIENNVPVIVKNYEDPVLTLGEKGTFSQYGVGMGAFWPNQIGGDLYFVAFDRPAGFKFKAFTGKAIYNSSLNNYSHASSMPQFGPEWGGETIVGLHDIFRQGELLHALVSIGTGFEQISGKDFPKYQVHIASGPDLDNLVINPDPIIRANKPTYRIGRPRITKTTAGYEILVTAGTTDGSYLPEIYYSDDLKVWTRGDVGNFTSNAVPAFDDRHQCYLSRFQIEGQEWIVYNGNDMGIQGFGFARGELIAD